jgi:hypothetical protein
MAGIYASLDRYNKPGRLTRLPRWSKEMPAGCGWIGLKVEIHGGPGRAGSTTVKLEWLRVSGRTGGSSELEPRAVTNDSRRQAPKGDPVVAHTTRPPPPPPSTRGGWGVLLRPQEDWERPRRAEGGSPQGAEDAVDDGWMCEGRVSAEMCWGGCDEVCRRAAGTLGVVRSESGPGSSPELG